MKYCIKSLLLSILFSVLGSVGSHAASLTLESYNTITFEDLGDQPLSNATPPWTGAGAPILTGTVATGTGNTNSNVVQAPGSTRYTAVSPAQSLADDFKNATTGELLYFSAWMLKNGGEGGVIFSTNDSSGNLNNAIVGFGMGANATGAFTYFNGTSLVSSSVLPKRNNWYELVYVIDYNRENPALSLGYFYYREVGTETYYVIPEVNGVTLTWLNESRNPTDFSYYRIEAARNNTQFDNFSVGIVIPEPGSAAALGVAGILFAVFRRKKRF